MQEIKQTVDTTHSSTKLNEGLTSLSTSLAWLHDRAWPLSGYILFTTIIYLNSYITQEQVPLSITSTAVLTALPPLFALVLFTFFTLAAFLLTPTLVIFTKINDNTGTLTDRWSELLIQAANKRPPWLKFALHWLAGLGVWFVYWLLMALIGNLPDSLVSHNLLYIFVSILAFFVFIGLVFVWREPLGISSQHFSDDFWFNAVFSAIFQLLVTLFTAVFASNVARQYGASNDLQFGGSALLALVALWLLQVICAIATVKLRQHHNPIGLIALSTAVLVLAMGLISPAGARLAGYAFQVTASGSRSCSVLRWAPEAKINDLLKSDSNSPISVELRILGEADGTYFVRPSRSDTKEIHFVHRSDFVSISQCEAKKSRQP